MELHDRQPGNGLDDGPPLSVLDLAMVADGSTSSDALAETRQVAVRADELGYRRIWVAEHHNMGSVASTTPAVLIADLAAATHSISVGSGGVMLPNHAPLAVAEQFALLEALHPGRIDLGIGRAPGTDRATAAALRRTEAHESEDEFPRHLVDLLGLLGDVRTERGLWQQFRATPVATSHPGVYLLGSSGFSAQLAGVLGLPFAFAHHFDMGGTIEAVEIYRDAFEPSSVLDRPRPIVTASVIVAESAERAHWLAAPATLRRYGLRTGHVLPLVPPDEALAHPDYARAEAMGSSAVLGGPEEVTDGLRRLARRTGASELMVFTPTHGVEERLSSLSLLARAWGLEPPAPSEPQVLSG